MFLLGFLQLNQADAAEARIITLQDAISIGLERSSALRQAENALSLSAVDTDEARSRFVPTLNIGAEGVDARVYRSEDVGGGAWEREAHSIYFGAASSLSLFNGFRDIAALRIAKLGEQASQLDLHRMRESTVLAVVAQFLEFVQGQRQLEVQQENLAAATGLERQISIYVETGDRPSADLYTQQSETANARLSLLNAQRESRLAKLRLVDTLELDRDAYYEFQTPADRDVPTFNSNAQLDGAAPADSTQAQQEFVAESSVELDALIDRALARRKDLQARRVEVQVAEKSISLAGPSRWPTVSLGAGYGRSYGDFSTADFSDQPEPSLRGSVVLGVTIPLFDFDSRRFEVRRARLQFENQKIALERSFRDVELQVRSAWLDYNLARQRRSILELQQRTAQLALNTTKERYQIGSATLVELSQARAIYFQSESARVGAHYAALFTRLALEYYVGDLESPRR